MTETERPGRLARLRRQAGTVRGRSALIAAGVVFAALVAGDVASIVALRSSMTDNLACHSSRPSSNRMACA